MSYFQLGREVYNSNGVSMVAVAIDDETAKVIVDALNSRPTPLAADGACAHEWDGGYPGDDNVYCFLCGTSRPAAKA